MPLSRLDLEFLDRLSRYLSPVDNRTHRRIMAELWSDHYKAMREVTDLGPTGKKVIAKDGHGRGRKMTAPFQ